MPSGSKVRFTCAERLVKHRAEHLPVERAAHQAIAVFGRKRAAEFQHQIRHLLGDGLELANPFLGLQIDHRPHVQAADRGVRVDSGRGSVAVDDFEKAVDVVAQLFGRHRGVFHEGDRFGVALHGHREAQRVSRRLQICACAAGSVSDR